MEIPDKSFGIYPAALNRALKAALEQFDRGDVIRRLWEHDHTLWSESKNEIDNRLDWLHLADTMEPKISELQKFANEISINQFEDAILLGMGGSSLAPEVFQATFGNAPGYPKLTILDTTDPNAILNVQSGLHLDKTIFIVATKSGGTVETLSLFKYFYNTLQNHPGIKEPGTHFIAITDPGSKLEQMGIELGFRKIFLNNPNIGGRYSALSYFGLVPAALIGMDIGALLADARDCARDIFTSNSPNNHFAIILGALLGVAAQQGIDKLTFFSDESITGFSEWVEQLVAESTGKSGQGILPVVQEKFTADLSVYGRDRIFVIQQLEENKENNQIIQMLRADGFPVIDLALKDKTQLGGLFLSWEVATVLAGHIMQIHPFDQPNVESAKLLANQSMKLFRESGALPKLNSSPLSIETLDSFLSKIQPGNYISIQAFVTPTPETQDAFRDLQRTLRDIYKVAVTFGFGPRFLHSTGQLHKGDAGNGFFLQFVSNSETDLKIPTQPGFADAFIDFETLKKAQALGDAEALLQAKRRLITFVLNEPFDNQIREITEKSL